MGQEMGKGRKATGKNKRDRKTIMVFDLQISEKLKRLGVSGRGGREMEGRDGREKSHL